MSVTANYPPESAARPNGDRSIWSRWRAGLAVVGLGALVSTSVLAFAEPAAAADPVPWSWSTDAPATVTADPLPTVQIDGVAWTQAIVGNTVYVGGEFQNARPAGAAAGTQLTPRSNLLAYNLQTGALITSWNPGSERRGPRDRGLTRWLPHLCRRSVHHDRRPDALPRGGIRYRHRCAHLDLQAGHQRHGLRSEGHRQHRVPRRALHLGEQHRPVPSWSSRRAERLAEAPPGHDRGRIRHQVRRRLTRRLQDRHLRQLRIRQRFDQSGSRHRRARFLDRHPHAVGS